MSFTSIVGMFHVDMLSIIMISLVIFIGIVVYFFSRRYMKGDALYRLFFLNILVLLISVILITIADNLVLFLSAWCCCNLILARLIVHKSTWKAAKASGRLAIRNFILGFSFIILAFSILYKVTGSLSIQYIVHNSNDYWYTLIALILLLMGAMTQSAIWPFHDWLISSLNAPTPVSALMHAGIVNGGGFLLARFSPLYFSFPKILSIIFIVGLTGALLGSLWKMMQHDVKRMLACSTMGQMGFMFVQFGLGFFASGLAHLFWHGMFKSYLFLASGSAAQEKRLDLGYPPSLICFLFSLACGAVGSYIFAIINYKNWLPSDTSLVIIGIVFITGAQLALTVLRGASAKKFPLAMIVTAAMATFYGANVYFFDLILSPLELMQPQPLNIFHVISLIMLALSWLFILFFRYSNYKADLPNWFMHSYVKALNNSQSHPDTITSYRKGYDYV
jgi:NAD(P)H-quinone oxidoreductase subunit 5